MTDSPAANQVAETLHAQFEAFNVPPPPAAVDRVRAAAALEDGTAQEHASGHGLEKHAPPGMLHVDTVLDIALDEWRKAADARADELLQVFQVRKTPSWQRSWANFSPF